MWAVCLWSDDMRVPFAWEPHGGSRRRFRSEAVYFGKKSCSMQAIATV